MSNFLVGSKISYQNNYAVKQCNSQPIRPVDNQTCNKAASKNIHFGYAPTAQNVVNTPVTALVTPQEKQMYNTIAGALDKKTKANLDEMLKTGRLLSSKSNDGSTTLDNLYKIATTPRMRGLDAAVILKEAVTTINNPFLITQKFGDVPRKLQQQIITDENNYIRSHPNQNPEGQHQHKEIAEQDLNVKSNCCVAASIEFNIAHRTPAEFARMAEQLTSDKMSVTKTISPNAIAINTIDAIWLANEFNTKHKFLGWDKVEMELNPDRNAIIRARIQNSYKDPHERSLIDVLMQSMIMNIGSQQTYNTLTDLRTGKFNNDNEGLTNIEKNYAESLVTGNNTILVTYQIIDENCNLLGYECTFPEMKKHISDALNKGQNVIIGYTYPEADGTISKNGHEITIVGIEKDAAGVEYFVCKDTDNNSPAPIKYKVDDFLPRIHHAGLPKDVLTENVEFVETWTEVLNNYKAERLRQSAPIQPNSLIQQVQQNMAQAQVV